jgi:hypothetical protein
MKDFSCNTYTLSGFENKTGKAALSGRFRLLQEPI